MCLIVNAIWRFSFKPIVAMKELFALLASYERNTGRLPSVWPNRNEAERAFSSVHTTLPANIENVESKQMELLKQKLSDYRHKEANL